MWANWETVAGRMALGHNERHVRDKVGFYGLDVYSLWESFDEVLKYLENKDLTIKKAALDALIVLNPTKEGRTGVRPACDASFVVLRR
jgi:hypothetical protein